MYRLSRSQWEKMDDWIGRHARPLDQAKWNYLFRGGDRAAIVDALMCFQNPDGGMGHGLEADLSCPMSAAIPSAEAIFTAYAYDLDCSADWFARLLGYFERTVQDIPKYWEDIPREAMAYPHAPWWKWAPCAEFNPNPCAVVASAFLLYGSDVQRAMGRQIAEDCFAHLVSDRFCGDHDTLNLLVMVDRLRDAEPSYIPDAVMIAMQRRILENTCFDVRKYGEYCFTPLDFVQSPDSIWLETVAHGIEPALDDWLARINADGVWTPNFSWGSDSEAARRAMQDWTGHITVKRAGILLRFGRIEL